MPKLLDTTVLIDHSVDLPGAIAIVQRLFEESDDILLCDAVVAEALSSGTEVERRTISTLIDALEFVSTSPEAARWAGETRRRRGLAGPRSLGDALIGGVAVALGATVVTRNPDDFIRMGVPVLAYGVGAPAPVPDSGRDG
jgi:predicted nucleic acid-binding protein